MVEGILGRKKDISVQRQTGDLDIQKAFIIIIIIIISFLSFFLYFWLCWVFVAGQAFL